MRISWVLWLFILAGCVTTNFTAFVGDRKIYQGLGGALETVEGVDIWSRGTPNKKFVVVGFLDDSRPSGVLSLTRKKDLALLAKQNGAQGVIIIDQNNVFAGTISSGSVNFASLNSANYSGVSHAIYRMETQAVAINYAY